MREKFLETARCLAQCQHYKKVGSGGVVLLPGGFTVKKTGINSCKSINLSHGPGGERNKIRHLK